MLMYIPYSIAICERGIESIYVEWKGSKGSWFMLSNDENMKMPLQNNPLGNASRLSSKRNAILITVYD